MPARVEYRTRALASEPLFGATEGVSYVINPSPEGMHALRSRMILERFDRASPRVRETYLRIMGCCVPNALPPAFFPNRALIGRNIYEETATVEHLTDLSTVVTPRPAPVAPGRVTRFSIDGQITLIDVDTPQRSLLFVNHTYFSAWDARANGERLDTLPVDIDRLGIIVPAGKSHIELRFGRHRAAVPVAWIVSTLALLACAFVELRDRRAREVQRAGDENRAVA